MTADDLPNVGEELSFSAHGKRFRITKPARDSWALRQTSPPSTRVRWGNAAQILADFRHVAEFGTLPPKSPGVFT